ncbi:MAG: hypothetical protein KDE27_09030 [Planctomycetes bacterium]|nr:hypothetical protein [Planctomycetota bacterium]
MTHARPIVAVLGLALAVGCLRAQDVVLRNPTGVARKQWVDVAVPAIDAASLPRLCRFEPNGWIAYRGRTVGEHSVMFHVLADMPARSYFSGRLAPVTNNAASLPPWGMSDWVSDNTFAVLPLPVVVDTDFVEHRLQQPTLEIVEDVSPARRVFHLGGRIGTSAFVFDAYLYIYAAQDSVDVECTFTCSDPRLDTMSYSFVGVWLESGEYMRLDYRERLGLSEPKINYDPNSSGHGRWMQPISGPAAIGRGEGIAVRGSMQCFVSPGRQATPMSYFTHGMGLNWSIADRVDGLFARHDKPTVGIWKHWQDKWLAFGMVPEVPAPFRSDNGRSDADATWNGFVNLMQQPSDVFAPRPRGLNKYAGTSGAQEDFGACKGAQAVTVGDPRWLIDAGYSVAAVAMRGFHYREVDGSPMRFGSHQGLQCFSQRPNCKTTADTLGLPCPLPYVWSTNGWSTYDDQHRSQNNFNALLALTGRYALDDQLRDLVEVDMAMVPNWMDSPRGEGRLMMAWANMLLLDSDPQQRQALRQTMLNRIQTVQNSWLGRQFAGNPAKPVRVLQTGSDGSFLEPGTQDRVRAIIVWEHSIATMGFYAAWRTTGDQRFLQMAREISRMIVNHCVFRENNHWVAATAVRYLEGDSEGDAMAANRYYTGSPDVHVGINFWPWILPAVLICREVHTGLYPGLVTRCDNILQDVVPNGPNNWLDAEWWAVLPR